MLWVPSSSRDVITNNMPQLEPPRTTVVLPPLLDPRSGTLSQPLYVARAMPMRAKAAHAFLYSSEVAHDHCRKEACT